MRRLKALFVLGIVWIIMVIAAPVGNASTWITGAEKCVTTNGDILAMDIVYRSQNYLALGGNFTKVYNNGNTGTPVTVKNFAIVNTVTCKVVYAGNVNSYVRAIHAIGSTFYLGGDFTYIAGKYRKYAAQVQTTNFTVTSWQAQQISSKVNAISSDPSKIYLGTNNSLFVVSASTGSVAWVAGTTLGPVRAVSVNTTLGAVYVGGLFETIGASHFHGLAALRLDNGSPIAGFQPNLRRDTGEGIAGTFDGEGVLSIAWDWNNTRIVVGIGSAAGNSISAFNWNTGEKTYYIVTPGDVQAVAVLNELYFAGYHRSADKNPWYPGGPGYFAQLYYALGYAIPGTDFGLGGGRVSGNDNADKGNGGVQAVAFDQTQRKFYIGGAFTEPFHTLAFYRVYW